EILIVVVEDVCADRHRATAIFAAELVGPDAVALVNRVLRPSSGTVLPAATDTFGDRGVAHEIRGPMLGQGYPRLERALAIGRRHERNRRGAGIGDVDLAADQALVVI